MQISHALLLDDNGEDYSSMVAFYFCASVIVYLPLFMEKFQVRAMFP